MNKVVKIINAKQAGLYIKHGVQPLRMYYTDRLVFEFDKEETKELFALWCDHKLN